MINLNKSWLGLAALISVSATSCLRNTVEYKSATTRGDKPQLVLETGHADRVRSVAFSSDGKILASGSLDDTVKLWSVANGSELCTLRGHTDGILSVAFSPDDRTLASGGGNTITLWDITTRVEVRTLKGHTSVVHFVRFTPDGQTLVSGSLTEAKFWDVTTGTELRTLKEQSDRYSSCIALSGDGQRLAIGGDSGIIELWDATNGTKLAAFRTGVRIAHLDFSAYGGMLAGTTFDGTIKLWSSITGAEIGTIKTGPVTAAASLVAFSPDGQTLVSGGIGESTILWDTGSGHKRCALNERDLFAVAFSPDGKMLASGNFNHTITLWDPTTGTQLRTLIGHADTIHFAALNPDGLKLATASGDNTIKLWDLSSNENVQTLKGHDDVVLSLAFSPDGKTLASESGDSAIKLWDVVVGTEKYNLSVGVGAFSLEVVFSPDSKMVASGGPGDTIELWDVATGKKRRTLSTHPNVTSIVFSPNSKTLASASYVDGTIKQWDLAAGREIRSLRAEVIGPSLAFSPDAQMLATGGPRDSIKLWDAVTGAEIRTFEGHRLGVNEVVFSRDGKMLASCSHDNTIKLWDVNTGMELRTLLGHTNHVFSISFSLDGKTLVSGSWNDAIKLWDVATGVELASLISFDNGGWVVVTPDGRFDTNRIDDVKGLHWLMPETPLTPLPIEIFMRDYYEPKLLSRILAREKFKPVRDFSTINRTQPKVKITDIAPDSAETVQVTVEVANVKSEVQASTLGLALESGVYDLRLFRDGQLVGYAPTNDGKVALSFFGEKATLKFPNIKWPRTGVEQVEFSAYAFNSDRIKSATDRKTYKLTSLPAQVKGRAYLISLGVNAYEREGLNLRYAAADARRVQEGLAGRLAAQGEYEEVVSVPLVSDYDVASADGRALAAQDATITEVRQGKKRVTENNATKAHLRAVLDVLAGRQADAALLKETPNADKLRAARPEDLILISVSSHGYTDSDGIFYIVPSDTGTAAVSSPEFRKHCISSDELSRWLRDVDAGELVMIIDACHSSAAVEGTDFKPGPMGSRGLGQLSYDKGMRILTATQADNVAMETNKVRQGLLTYALLNEGLNAWQADYKPRDNQITLTEWLGYGVERVPHLYEEVKAGAMRVSDTGTNLNGAVRIIRDTVDPRESDNDKTQQPSLFDFARRRRDVVLVGQR
jgi:WD40 repeat protein